MSRRRRFRLALSSAALRTKKALLASVAKTGEILLWPWLHLERISAAGHPLLSMSPWLGTMFGSWMVSGAQSNPPLFLAGITVAFVGVLPLAAEQSARRKVDRDEDTMDARERLVIASAAGYLEDLAIVTTASRKARVTARDRVIVEVLDLLAEIYTGIDFRSVLYVVSDDQSHLLVRDQRGRSDEARPFDRADHRGELAFARLVAPEPHIFVADTADAPEGWGGSGRGYRTFASAPITAGDSAYGMVTLDAPDVGDLTPRDGYIVEILASVLAVYFAEAARGARSR